MKIRLRDRWRAHRHNLATAAILAIPLATSWWAANAGWGWS